MKAAIIDIGSNSVRINVFADERVYLRDLRSTRLGKGLASGEYMLESSIADTVLAVKDFAEIAKEQNADVYLFGTEAIRRAKNSDELLRRITEQTGLTVDVIDGKLEGEIGFIGGVKGSPENGLAVLDIGGGSTEIAFRSNGAITSKSVPIGSVIAAFKSGDKQDLADKLIGDELCKFTDIPKGLRFYGIGGTITAIAAILSGKEEYDINVTDGFVIKRERLKALCERLFTLSVEERGVYTAISLSRRETIACGALILLKVMEMLKLDEITSSESDNLYGYLKGCVYKSVLKERKRER